MPETLPQRWFAPALAAVAALTALRVLALAFDRTDLFVDEAQYWLWGQNFEAGYYSKPPLIAWVIGAVTGLAGSDSPFWVRVPGPFLHGTTALILAAAAKLLWGGRAALWTALTYATLPFTAVGSAMISTDTVLAPFYATALLAILRAGQGGGLASATIAGAALGAAFLAKYAAVYLFVGLALAQFLVPSRRLGAGQALAMLAAFLAVAAPNLFWNAAHDFTTVSHTVDNAGWVRGGVEGGLAGLGRLAGFLGSQAGVFGPIALAALVLSFRRWRDPQIRWLLCLVLPPLILVSGQAFLSKAYANWGLTAYFPGTLVAVAMLLSRPRLLALSAALHLLICTTLPVLTAIAPVPRLGNDRPLLSRYLGRAALSEAIIVTARGAGLSTVVAENRDVLADLFYTGRESDLDFRAVPPKGRPLNFYQQQHALDPDKGGLVLAVLDRAPQCDGSATDPLHSFDTRGTAYAGRDFAAYVISADCARGL